MRRSARTMAAGVAVAALLLAGCGDDDDDTASTEDTTETTAEATDTTAASDSTAPAGEGVTVADQWSRSTAPTQENGAVYMNLTAAADDALVGASVDASIAAVVEIHETVPASEAGPDAMPMGGSMEEEESMEGDSTITTAMMDDSTTTAMMDDSSTTAMGGEGDDMGGEGGGMAEGMVMQPVERIELPAGETVSLEPGGYHIMLLQLAEPLVAGDTFDVTLTFENAPEQTVTVEVRDM